MNLNHPNEYGVPLHACNGHKHDAHYWAWLNSPAFDAYMRAAGYVRLGERG